MVAGMQNDQPKKIFLSDILLEHTPRIRRNTLYTDVYAYQHVSSCKTRKTLVLGPEWWWTTPEKGNVRRDPGGGSWTVQKNFGKGNERPIEPSKKHVLLEFPVRSLELYQVKRMIKGIRNVLFSTFSQTFNDTRTNTPNTHHDRQHQHHTTQHTTHDTTQRPQWDRERESEREDEREDERQDERRDKTEREDERERERERARSYLPLWVSHYKNNCVLSQNNPSITFTMDLLRLRIL